MTHEELAAAIRRLEQQNQDDMVKIAILTTRIEERVSRIERAWWSGISFAVLATAAIIMLALEGGV